MPALTFQIVKEYFDEKLSDQANNFKLTNGPNGAFYERTIPEDDLTLSFDSEKDGKLQSCGKIIALRTILKIHVKIIYSAILLSYTLELASSSTNFQLSDGVSIGFVIFQELMLN